MTTIVRRAVTFVFVTLIATVAAQQSPVQQSEATSSTSLIFGRTVDGTTGKGIGGAVVSLTTAAVPGAVPGPPEAPATLSRFPARVISDAEGYFVFRDLPKGSYTLTANKPGYAITGFGRRTATDTINQTLLLGDGERRGDVALRLWKFATLGGTVVDESGEPIIGVQVRVFRRAIVGGRMRFTQFGNMPITDDRGAYRSSGLSPGDYVVGIVSTQTTMPTSLQEAYAAAAKSGTTQEFQRELDRSAGLLGNLGMMASGQRVGSWFLQASLGFGSERGVTPPPVAGDKVFVYPTVFYPAATTLSKAATIPLGSGEERSAIDFQLTPVVTSRVSGTLTGPNGLEARTSLDLMPAGVEDAQRDYDLAAATTVTDATGAFTFLGVPPGVYTIRALKVPPRPLTPSTMTTVIQTGTSTIFSGGGPSAPPPIPNDPTWWATVPVSVGQNDVADVAVALHSGARISGRLEFEGTAEKPAADRLPLVNVQIDRADGRTTSSNQFTLGRGVVDVAAQFKTYQLPPGRYVVRATGAVPGWTFKSATLGGRDISDTPLDLGGEDVGNVVVTFTDRPTELSGTVRDSKGPDSTATVIVFPAQSALWEEHGPSPRRFRSARAGTDGIYRLGSLPPGEYLVVGLRTGIPPDWMDGGFLKNVAALATRVTIADGDKKTQDLEAKEAR
jgi:Carboxypeptidase regulatory-like domain